MVVYIAGYIALKICSTFEECCSHLMFGKCDKSDYLQIFSRGGLQSPSQLLYDYVCQSFAILDASYIEVTQKSSLPLPARVAAQHILSSQISTAGLTCCNHEFIATNKINRIICNVFLNNERKRKNFLRDERQSQSIQAVKKGNVERF